MILLTLSSIVFERSPEMYLFGFGSEVFPIMFERSRVHLEIISTIEIQSILFVHLCISIFVFLELANNMMQVKTACITAHSTFIIALPFQASPFPKKL